MKQKTNGRNKCSSFFSLNRKKLQSQNTYKTFKMTQNQIIRELFYESIFMTKNQKNWGQGDGSGFKSTDCSSRGPELNPQQSKSASQLSILEI